MELPPDLARGRVLYALCRPLYGSPIAGLRLRRRGGASIQPVKTDAWPRSPERGRDIAQGLFRLAGQEIREPVPLGRPVGAEKEWRVAFNGFAWLGDLAALGPAAAPVARAFVQRWIEENQRFEALAWRLDVMGRRLASWLGEPVLVDAGEDPAARGRLCWSVAKQARHLASVLPAGLCGERVLSAVKGLVYAGLALGGESLLQAGLKQLKLALPRQLLADGGHAERSPAVQLSVLRDLVDIRAALEAAGHEPPAELARAIAAMAPALRMFQSGDGGLALFNDSDEGPAGAVDLVLLRADAKAPALASAPQSGFERLAAGASMLLVDAGRPAGPGFDSHAHAGTLGFEFSHGRERLIVNCGAQESGGDWRLAQRSTAAHSTLSVDDTNSSLLLEDGEGIARRPANVTATREEAEGNSWLDLSHDGYRPRFGLVHHRRLYLSADGTDLRGQDRLESAGGKRSSAGRFALRFHLHPDVHASLALDGQAVLLRLPRGGGFRLRVAGGEVALAESVYLGRPGERRRCQQVAVTGEIQAAGAEVKWSLTKESRRK
jgi:uncharacterized heparinase superfamily protein